MIDSTVHTPPVNVPADRRPLMLGASYAKKSTAKRRAAEWNGIIHAPGYVIGVGFQEADGTWPLEWQAVAQSRVGRSGLAQS